MVTGRNVTKAVDLGGLGVDLGGLGVDLGALGVDLGGLGVDLGGVPRSRVYSTSPGVVTFVGNKGPYGRMVEIDHGLGLRTRYGHLRKILVKLKEKVAFRHKIGQMGSSGRSTGSHVHYEVLFDGKPIDPMKFLKAGMYVFKG